MPPALRLERRSDGIVREIVDAVRSGRLAAGERLPSERQLAESLGISRVSVREGLRILELLEIVEVRPGAGNFVVRREAGTSGRLLRHWLATHSQEVIELLEVREALEVRATEAAASRRALVPPPVVDETAPVEEITAADIRFHNAIAQASGNAVLSALIHELNGVLEESRYAMFAIPGRPASSTREHARIASAIRAGNAERAGDAMRSHIARVRRRILAMDRSQEPAAT